MDHQSRTKVIPSFLMSRRGRQEKTSEGWKPEKDLTWLLLVLDMKEEIHKPKNAGSLWKLEKGKETDLLGTP